MTWQGIRGHDDVVDYFRQALASGRLASTFLFTGPGGVGKRRFALALAQSLLCARAQEAELAPCGTCDACRQVLSGTHPDLTLIGKPADRAFLPLKLLIGDDERRSQEGLCYELTRKPLLGTRKVAILDDADYLLVEGANALLKTLEEPPPRSVLILLGTSAQKQLPTIRSRCQILRFRPLASADVAELLLELQWTPTRAEAERIASYSEGSLDVARDLLDAALWQFRSRLFDQLAAGQRDIVALAAEVNEFIDAAGKESSARRGRARQTLAFALLWYRQFVRALSGAAAGTDAELAGSVRGALGSLPTDAEAAAACVERTLLALEQVDRFLLPALLIEAWLDDVARTLEAAQPSRGPVRA